MIFERVGDLGRYFPAWWAEAETALRSLNPATPDGETPVRGRDLYLRVLTYDTVQRQEAILEAHRAYADIQVVLAGAERIAVWPADALRERVPYDAALDVVYFVPPERDQVLVTLEPGFAAVFFPRDAHMPQLSSGVPGPVKKAVLKVSVTLLSGL